jgi:hypothetical protein
MNSKNKIVLCEIYHYAIHGHPEKINKEVSGHWLVIDHYDNIFPSEVTGSTEGYNSDDSSWYNESFEDNSSIIDAMHTHKAKYVSYLNSHQFERRKHWYIRNYLKIVSRENYIQPHIAEIVHLNNNNDDLYYSVAIIKTIWLRIVQKKWKRIFKERQNIIILRSNIKSQRYREIYGKWPENCNHYPLLKGMLNNLT